MELTFTAVKLVITSHWPLVDNIPRQVHLGGGQKRFADFWTCSDWTSSKEGNIIFFCVGNIISRGKSGTGLGRQDSCMKNRTIDSF